MPSTSHTSRRTTIIVNEAELAADVFEDAQSGHKALLGTTLEFLNGWSQVYTANQTNLTILTPQSGARICVHAVTICTESNTGDVEIDFLTSGKPVARLYASRFQQALSMSLHIEGAQNEVITLTTTTGANDVFIAISYGEEAQ